MKLINMCVGCEDKLFGGIECKGCRCSCHKQDNRDVNNSNRDKNNKMVDPRS